MDITILTPMEFLKYQLLIIETAGRTCYRSYKGEPTEESSKRFIRMILKRGHESVIEHSVMTVRFGGVSRGKTHELVRHRIASFSQMSTRYVDVEGFDMVLPPDRESAPGCVNVMLPRMDHPVTWDVADLLPFLRSVYVGLRAVGWKPEDARQFLPIGMTNEIVISANFRQWRHIFEMRTAKPAHWEIREGMTRLLEMVREPLSPIFDDFVLDGECSKGIPCYRKITEKT